MTGTLVAVLVVVRVVGAVTVQTRPMPLFINPLVTDPYADRLPRVPPRLTPIPRLSLPTVPIKLLPVVLSVERLASRRMLTAQLELVVVELELEPLLYLVSGVSVSRLVEIRRSSWSTATLPTLPFLAQKRSEISYRDKA